MIEEESSKQLFWAVNQKVVSEHEDGSYYFFLDALRQSGKINMFGAPKILEQNFGMTRKRALEIFKAWTKTYE
jgi:hypothetical protein